MCVNKRYVNSTTGTACGGVSVSLYLYVYQVHTLVEFLFPCIYTYTRYILWWSFCFLVFTRIPGTSSGGVSVSLYLHVYQVHPLEEFLFPCINTYTRYILWWSFCFLVFIRIPGTSSGGVVVVVVDLMLNVLRCHLTY